MNRSFNFHANVQWSCEQPVVTVEGYIHLLLFIVFRVRSLSLSVFSISLDFFGIELARILIFLMYVRIFVIHSIHLYL